MLRKLSWPLLVWVATSAALIALAAQVENGAMLAAVYVGANVIGVGVVLSRRPPYPDRGLRAVAWCAAAQLPVMIVPLFDRELTRPGRPDRHERGRRGVSDSGQADNWPVNPRSLDAPDPGGGQLDR